MKLNQLKSNPNNPRLIKDDKFKKLVTSLREFPEMMEKRPMVCVTDADGKLYPLGGNMRLKALQELKYKEIPDAWIMLADEWSEEKRNRFTISDNVSFGEWRMDELLSNWDVDLLKDWGLEVDEDEKENKKSVGTVGNAIITDRPFALVLLEIKDEIDMANFKAIFGDEIWTKNNAKLQKMIFDYIYFVEKLKQ